MKTLFGVNLKPCNKFLIFETEKLEKLIKKDIIVTSAFRKNDTKTHGAGLALDIIAEMPLLDFFIAANRFKFGGIGVYPYWKYNGKQTGGIHVDVRQKNKTIQYGARWMQDKDKNYIELNEQNIIKHCLSTK